MRRHHFNTAAAENHKPADPSPQAWVTKAVVWSHRRSLSRESELEGSRVVSASSLILPFQNLATAGIWQI
jgi:hypothetical protein